MRRLSDISLHLNQLKYLSPSSSQDQQCSRSFMDVKAASNGVSSIEDRILRITGYYGYYPGYSSHQKMWDVGACFLGHFHFEVFALLFHSSVMVFRYFRSLHKEVKYSVLPQTSHQHLK